MAGERRRRRRETRLRRLLFLLVFARPVSSSQSAGASDGAGGAALGLALIWARQIELLGLALIWAEAHTLDLVPQRRFAGVLRSRPRRPTPTQSTGRRLRACVDILVGLRRKAREAASAGRSRGRVAADLRWARGWSARPSLATSRRRELSLPVCSACLAGGRRSRWRGRRRFGRRGSRTFACISAPVGVQSRPQAANFDARHTSGRMAAGARPRGCPLRRKVPSGRMMAAGLGPAQRSLSDSEGKGAKRRRMAAGASRLRRARYPCRSRRVSSWRPGRRARRAAAAPFSRIKHTFRPTARSARVLPDSCVCVGGVAVAAAGGGGAQPPQRGNRSRLRCEAVGGPIWLRTESAIGAVSARPDRREYTCAVKG